MSISSTDAQTLSGYTINDYLINAIHPNGCNPNHVIGPPDDLICVNFNTNDLMTGNFGQMWTDTPGNELLLETGFHTDNYIVRLLLSSGLYSSTHQVNTSDWIEIDDVQWQALFTNCVENSYFDERFILPLDFDQDFGLNPSDSVIGIEIKFSSTPQISDLAGVYIVDPILGIKDYEYSKSVNIYPVPMTQDTRIHIDGFANFKSLEIIDITGSIIYSKKIKNVNIIMFDQFNFKNGVYFLKFNNDSHSIIKKIAVNQY